MASGDGPFLPAPRQMLSRQAIRVQKLPFPKHGAGVPKQLQVHRRPQVQVSVSPPPPPAFQDPQGVRMDRT